MERKGPERTGMEGIKERSGQERSGEERNGLERMGAEGKGKERNKNGLLQSHRAGHGVEETRRAMTSQGGSNEQTKNQEEDQQ